MLGLTKTKRNNMKEQFVSYKIALKLKELEFDEVCFAHYCNGDLITKTAILKSSTMQYYQQNNINPSNQYKGKKCTAPLWQQVIDWFREFKNIVIEVWYDNTQDDGFPWLYEIYINNKEHEHNGSYYDSFYEAREQAILKAIELI